jgi:cytochrome c biogenesis protein CcmG/thiol:disulfide interchange protein DsbE
MASLGPARWLAVPLLALPVSWLLFTGLGRDPRDIASPLVGHPVPTFSAATLDGRTVSSTELRGRPMIVNFWASWCAPCVDEHPVLLGAASRYAKRVTVVGVIYQDTPESAAGFLARWGDGGWANLLDGDGRIAVDFGVTGPPETFFVGADGVVRARHIGPLTFDVMAEQLAALGLDR